MRSRAHGHLYLPKHRNIGAGRWGSRRRSLWFLAQMSFYSGDLRQQKPPIDDMRSRFLPSFPHLRRQTSPPAPATIPSYTNNGPTCTKEQELNASNNGVRISENLSLEIRIRCRVLLGMGHLWMPDYDRAVYRYFRLDTRLERPMAPVGQMRWHRWQPTHLVPMIRG